MQRVAVRKRVMFEYQYMALNMELFSQKVKIEHKLSSHLILDTSCHIDSPPKLRNKSPMGNDQKYRLHHSLGYQLSMAARIQERRLDEGLKILGLTRISWCVLLAVGNAALEHPSEIAQFVGIDRTATSRILRQMEAAGMIARSTGKSDRRMTSVRLTRAGVEALERGTPYAQDNNDIMAQRLNPNELAQLRALLEKVRAGEDVPLSGL